MSDSVGVWLQAAACHPLLTSAKELHLGTIVQAWQQHPDGPDGAPAAIRRRGLKAKDCLLSADLSHVSAVVKKYSRAIECRHLEMVDALQAGAVGLVRGVEKFDPARGYKFSTYGYCWIRQAITR